MGPLLGVFVGKNLPHVYGRILGRSWAILLGEIFPHVYGRVLGNVLGKFTFFIFTAWAILWVKKSQLCGVFVGRF